MFEYIGPVFFAVWIVGWVIPVIYYHRGNSVSLPWATTWTCENCGRRHIHPRIFEPEECSNCGELNWQTASKKGEIPS